MIDLWEFVICWPLNLHGHASVQILHEPFVADKGWWCLGGCSGLRHLVYISCQEARVKMVVREPSLNLYIHIHACIHTHTHAYISCVTSSYLRCPGLRAPYRKFMGLLSRVVCTCLTGNCFPGNAQVYMQKT